MFCKNCGKELADTAYVCTGCGCLVKDVPETNPPAVAPMSNKKIFSLLSKICLILSFVCGMCAIASYAVAVAFPDLYVSVDVSLNESIIGTYYFSEVVHEYYNPNFGWCISAMCSVSCHAALAIPAFVFAILDKKEDNVKMISLLNLIAAAFLFLVFFAIFFYACL